MKLELAITLRYFLSPRAQGEVSFITWVALVGVTLGVAALVVAMAVMNGYQANLVRAMAGSLPHLSLNPTYKSGIEEPEALAEQVRLKLHPESVGPFALRETLVRGAPNLAGSIRGVMVRGIVPEQEVGATDFLTFLDDGGADWPELSTEARQARARALLLRLGADFPGGAAPVLLSRALARKLGVELGGQLTPMSFPKPGEGFSPRPAQQELVVIGFFETGLSAFDELVLVTHLDHAEQVAPGRPLTPSLGIRLREPLRAGEAAQQMRRMAETAGLGFYVYSWLESNQGIFQVIRAQKVMLYLVLMLIVVIAFFGMVSALTMLVAEKGKEIAVLKSLGVEERSIRAIFLSQGLVIGLVGTALGVALGLGVCAVLDAFPIIEIPAGVYPGTDRVPVRVALSDLLWIVGGAMTVCLGATIVPARKAAALQPAEALRFR